MRNSSQIFYGDQFPYLNLCPSRDQHIGRRAGLLRWVLKTYFLQ